MSGKQNNHLETYTNSFWSDVHRDSRVIIYLFAVLFYFVNAFFQGPLKYYLFFKLHIFQGRLRQSRKT